MGAANHPKMSKEKKRKQISPYEAQRLAAASVIRQLIRDNVDLIDILKVPYELSQKERDLIWQERWRIVEMLKGLRGPPIKWSPQQPKCPTCGKLADEKTTHPSDPNYAGQQWTYYHGKTTHTVWGSTDEDPYPLRKSDEFQIIR